MALLHSTNLHASLRGDILEGMARQPLFTRETGEPVLAVTWPFHSPSVLLHVGRYLTSQGYDVRIQKRDDVKIYELIVGCGESDSKPPKGLN